MRVNLRRDDGFGLIAMRDEWCEIERVEIVVTREARFELVGLKNRSRRILRMSLAEQRTIDQSLINQVWEQRYNISSFFVVSTLFYYMNV